MTKYIAIFELPAVVQVAIEVEAGNQQDGIVNAHDQILQALPAQAKVISLQAQGATCTSFEQVQAKTDAPPNPLEIAGLYRVEFRKGMNAQVSPEVVRTVTGLPYGTAKTLAESILAADSQYGSAYVYDQFNNLTLQVKAPIGDFIVTVHYKDDLPPKDAEVFPWIATGKEAKVLAVSLLGSRKNVDRVCIQDFTDRTQAPRLIKEIR